MYAKYLKRPLDFCCALAAILCLSPILVVLTVLGAIKMKGNPFFTQPRPGLNEKIFRMIKFRSMTCEKGEDGNLLPDEKRLTKYGKMLRSTSLDELPELFNILKGDMSLVGPRPLATVYLPFYKKNEHHRHDVRPGLTGWAQVNGRNSIDWEAKFKYDLEYIEKKSFLFDFKVILLTIKKVFVRDGIGQGMDRPESLHIIRSHWLDEKGSIKVEFDK